MGERQPGPGRFGLILAVAGVALGAGLGWLQRPEIPAPSPLPPTTAEPAPIEIHVAGWVVSPGVVSIPAGSLVADAIRAAGGLKHGARTEGINLAAEVVGGQQLVVPGPGGGGPHSWYGDAGVVGGMVAVNRASAGELEALPGVGPVLAGRIVAYREQHGPFGVVEDLLAVPGIGEAKLAAIRDLITVP